jgi:putative phage-type endonuclease
LFFGELDRGTSVQSGDGKDSEREAWLKWRTKGIGGTDAVVIAGLSPWRTIQELWEEKVTGVSNVEENWAMRRGKELEPIARDIYSFQYNISVPAKNVVHPEYAFVKASLDGFNEESKLIVEIKSPGKKDLEIAKNNMIPDKYYPQVQWQMLAANSPMVDYVTFDGKETIYVKRIFADLRYQRNLLRLAKWFWHKVQNKIPIERYEVRLEYVPKR